MQFFAFATSLLVPLAISAHSDDRVPSWLTFAAVFDPDRPTPGLIELSTWWAEGASRPKGVLVVAVPAGPREKQTFQVMREAQPRLGQALFLLGLVLADVDEAPRVRGRYADASYPFPVAVESSGVVRRALGLSPSGGVVWIGPAQRVFAKWTDPWDADWVEALEGSLARDDVR